MRRTPAGTLAKIFSDVYTDHAWGGDASGELFSGTGSHVDAIVSPYVRSIRDFLAAFQVKPNVADLGCGDFNVGAQIRDLCDHYTAADIVPALIEQNRSNFAHLQVDFRVHDVTLDELAPVDVIFVRQVFQHLSNADIIAALDRIVGKCRYLVITEHLPASAAFTPNLDKEPGRTIRLDFGSGVRLDHPPFNLRYINRRVLCKVPEYAGVLLTECYEFGIEAVPDKTETLRDRKPGATKATSQAQQFFALLTDHGTLVAIDRVGNHLIHRRFSLDYRDLAIFEQRGDRISLCSALSGSGPISDQTSLSLEHYDDPSGEFKDQIIIKRNGMFGCAEPSGQITPDRHAVNSWERFTKVPISNANITHSPISHKNFSFQAPIYPSVSRIPKSLHQTYRSTQLPQNIDMTVRSLVAMNADFTHKLWTDDEAWQFIYDNFGREILTAYESINPAYGAARADLFRYLCIYKLGGVYLDIKSSISKPLRDILLENDVYILSQWSNGWGMYPELTVIDGGEFQQWHIAAAPGHPFLQAVISRVLQNIGEYDPRRHGVGKIGVLKVTGPVAYTLAISNVRSQHPHRVIDACAQGFIYSAVGDHKEILPNHYSLRQDPVVL